VGDAFFANDEVEARRDRGFLMDRFQVRAHRDRVNAKVMKEMEKMSMKEMPFDMKRMVYGGFKVLVDI